MAAENSPTTCRGRPSHERKDAPSAPVHLRRVGRRVEAAELLGVDRTTLYRLMRKYGIEAD
jgi:transcriptional regulator of acetoin/glycerol metabolism